MMKQKLKLLILTFCCAFSLCLNLNVFADSTIPDKMPSNNVIDPNHHVSKTTIAEIEQWNKSNQNTKLKPRFRLFVFDGVNQKTLEQIRTNTANKWRKTNDDFQDIYVVIGTKNHIIQTEYAASLENIINGQIINDWNEEAIKGLSKDDLTKGIHYYIKAMNKTINPVKDQKINNTRPDRIFIGILCIGGSIVLILVSLIVFLFYRWGNTKKRLKRSNYGYRGKDKLYPDMKGFIHNESWTEKRLRKYIKKLQNK